MLVTRKNSPTELLDGSNVFDSREINRGREIRVAVNDSKVKNSKRTCNFEIDFSCWSVHNFESDSSIVSLLVENSVTIRFNSVE